jgi:hypothetical protein
VKVNAAESGRDFVGVEAGGVDHDRRGDPFAFCDQHHPAVRRLAAHERRAREVRDVAVDAEAPQCLHQRFRRQHTRGG